MPTPLLPDIAGPATFGGNAHVNMPGGAINDQTDLDCKYYDWMVTQMAMAAFTQVRAFCRFSAGAVVVQPPDGQHGAVWGNTTILRPTVGRTSQGIYTVQWAASYSDLQAVPEVHTLAIRAAGVSCSHAANVLRCPKVAVTDARTLTVTVLDGASALQDCDELTVWWW